MSLAAFLVSRSHGTSPASPDDPESSQSGSNDTSENTAGRHRSENPLDGDDDGDTEPSAPGLGQTAQSRKRRGDDLTPLVPRVSQRLRLNPKEHKQLLDFAKLDSDERDLTLYGTMIQQGTHINQIQPVDAVFVPPQKLLNKLVYYSGLIVLCHETPGYREPATKILLQVMERYPHWGYNVNVQQDERKSNIVISHSQTALTNARSATKSLIRKSVGKLRDDGIRIKTQDILTLTRAIIAKLESARIVIKKTRATIEMCARFAFLRKIFLTQKSEKSIDYWPDVDNELERLRNECTPAVISGYFTEVLHQDLEQFGDIEAAEVRDVTIHTAQREVEAFATNNQATLGSAPTDDDDD